jgi:hypothetical protein
VDIKPEGKQRFPWRSCEKPPKPRRGPGRSFPESKQTPQGFWDKFFLEKMTVRAQTGAAGLRRCFAGGKTPCRKKGKFFL